MEFSRGESGGEGGGFRGLLVSRGLLANKGQRGGRGKREPLAKLGKHPTTESEVLVMDGRYGPYVTDGNVNATIPRGTDPKDVTLEQAVSLIDERAAKGPAKKRRKKAPTKKKAAAKKKPAAKKKS